MSRMKIALLSVGVLVLIIVLPIGLMFLTGTISMGTAGFRGEVKAIEVIKGSGTFKIQAYQGFFEKCEAIRAKEANINNLISVYGSNPDEKEAKVLLGLMNIRNNMVSEYNGESHAVWTEGQFRDESLPYTISLERRNTICG